MSFDNKPVIVDRSVYFGQNLRGAAMYALESLKNGPKLSERFQRFVEICGGVSIPVTL